VKLVKVADRTALGELIEYAESAGVQAEAQGAVPGKKTAFEEALAAAKQVYGNLEATEESIQTAHAGLLASIWDLGYQKADKAGLAKALEEAARVDTAAYTAASAEVFTKAKQAAALLLKNEELSTADQPAINRAIQELEAAIEGLVPVSSSQAPPASSTPPASGGTGGTGSTGGAGGRGSRSQGQRGASSSSGSSAPPAASSGSAPAASSGAQQGSSSQSTASIGNGEGPLTAPGGFNPLFILLPILAVLALAIALFIIYYKNKKREQ
ncbi:MAG: hypothetical protein ACK5L3_08765, partial [Oscillospiraceae bacterium]